MWVLLACVGMGALWGLSTAPATTRQGVDFAVSTHPIPLHVKAIDFLHRHSHYQLLADEMTRGCQTDRERVLAVFDWTRQHIRRTPKGWPIIDDHVWDIIIRGHGLDDQMADVFTTLATYAGVPAFWRRGSVALSLARVDGRWVLFDVDNDLIFTDASGAFMEVQELLEHPAQIEAIAGSLAPGGIPYIRHVERLRPFKVPETLRAHKQMPLPRLVFEVRRALQLVQEPEGLH